MNHSARGFTLIELSIVLVIIGLIVGGILTGQELIRSANIKSIITDEQRYVTAVNTFRTKYNELPGDMVDATNIWGTDPSGTGCPNGYNTGPVTVTCNGNGNGLIEGTEEAQDYSVAMNENWRAWQQLANAGLIPGAYTGTSAPNPYAANSVPGINVPPTKMPNGGWQWASYTPTSNREIAWQNLQLSAQYLMLGSTLDGSTGGALLTTADAYAIDKKLDDGWPGTGIVLGYPATNPFNCYAYVFGQPTSYNLSASTPQMVLLFAVKSW